MIISKSGPTPPAGGGRRRPTTFVLPVLVVALVLGAVALLVPSVRAQAGISFTRQVTPYVELSAVTLDVDHVGTTCERSPRAGKVSVTFSIGSHLEDAAQLDYRVRVATPSGPFGEDLTDGVALSPDQDAVRVAKVAAPADQDFDVQVWLVSTDQYLLFHCPVPA